MKFLVAFALAVAVVSADVSHLQNAEAGASVLRAEADVQPNGFNYVYETSNGIAAHAQGVISNPDTDHASQSVSGDYSYTSPEGTPIKLTYIANEDGFQPSGDHLPVPPPVPEAILRALQYIEAHPSVENVAQKSFNPPQKPVQSAYQKPASRKF